MGSVSGMVYFGFAFDRAGRQEVGLLTARLQPRTNLHLGFFHINIIKPQKNHRPNFSKEHFSRQERKEV